MTLQPGSNNRPTLSVSDSVRSKIEHRVQLTQFDTADEYATAALEFMLDGIEDEDASRAEDRQLAGGDEGVRERLESLGYL